MSEQTTENPTQATNATEDALPQWARDQITKANNEAAKYRTEKNEAVETVKQEVAASFQSKIEELEAQIAKEQEAGSSTRHEVDRIKVALEAGISNDKVLSFSELLKGDSPEELKSHAADLKKLFTHDEQPMSTAAVDPTQGQGSDNPLPLNGDPLLASIKSVLNIR